MNNELRLLFFNANEKIKRIQYSIFFYEGVSSEYHPVIIPLFYLVFFVLLSSFFDKTVFEVEEDEVGGDVPHPHLHISSRTRTRTKERTRSSKLPVATFFFLFTA